MAWGASSSAETLGKYQLVGKLARGGQAEVFLAVLQGAHDVNKLVVVKRMRTGRDANENFSDVDNVAMFLDEARLAARLHHPNVIHTYEVGEQTDGTPFIVMEYLEGIPLWKLVRHKEGRERISPLFWALFGSEVLSGLAYAHALADYDGSPLGIVHRDVSPQNVIVTYDGDVKLVDFGIAKAALNVSVTATGVFKGKVRYMAPEQLRGGCDQRADLFSLGVVLWEALAGRRLFEGDDVQVIRALIQDPIPSILNVRRDIDVELGAIIDKSLAKDADERWQTAQEMREALDAYLGTRRPKKLEIASLVRDLFKDLREEVQKQLAIAMAQLRPNRASTSIPVVSNERSERTSGSTRVMTPSGESVPRVPLPVILPTILQPSTPSETPIASALQTLAIPAPPKARHIWPMVGAGAVAVAIVCAVGIGVLVIGRGRPVDAAERSGAAEAQGGFGGRKPPNMGVASATTAAPIAPAFVQIDSDPPGAHVALGDRSLGKTPLHTEALGSHASFLLTQDGYEPLRLEVDLVPGQTRSESVKLTPLPQPRPITTTEKPNPSPPVLPTNTNTNKRPPPVTPKRSPRPTTTSSPVAQPTATGPSVLPLPPDRPSIKALDDDPKRNIKVLD